VGSKFYQKPPNIGAGGSQNMTARAIGSGAYQGRADAGAAQKDIAAAMALYKAHAFKPMKNSAAYPPGPKKV